MVLMPSTLVRETRSLRTDCTLRALHIRVKFFMCVDTFCDKLYQLVIIFSNTP